MANRRRRPRVRVNDKSNSRKHRQPARPNGDAEPSPATQPRRGDAPVLLTTDEAAEFLRISKITLARWRMDDIGPPYYKIGRRVVYNQSRLLDWLKTRERTSTSQQP